MLFTPAFLSALLVAASVPTASRLPDVLQPSRPPWQVTLSVLSGTPAVLPGLTVGGALEVSRQVRSGPWFVAGQLGLSSASAANASSAIDHRQLIVAVGLGVGARLGVGRLWAEAGAGALGIEETLTSHQQERIQMAGLPGGTQTSFVLGPYGFGEAGIGVVVRGALGARLSAGPIASRVALAGGNAWRFGAVAKVGFSYDF